MSAGVYTRTFYELDNGDIVQIRVQPETISFANGATSNSAPAGPATLPLTAKVSRGDREVGIRPRRVSFAFDPGEAPAGYEEGNLYYIPILDKSQFDAMTAGSAATYLTKSGRLLRKFNEDIR